MKNTYAPIGAMAADTMEKSRGVLLTSVGDGPGLRATPGSRFRYSFTPY
jgi:hypothetical protein